MIAEKYPAACDIANVLKCAEKREGYIEGDDYIITWADGHLIGFQYPEEYNLEYKEWKLEDLPLQFDAESCLKILPGKEQQFEIVKRLIQGPETDKIINAGDAGREGYLLQYWIYKMAGNKKPVKVLWTSSLTENAILEAFANLHEEKEFEGILEEAETRAEMDYILGMNYSRLLTLKCSKDVTLPYGRCMTSLLNLIIKKEKEISAYETRKTYGIEVEFEEGVKGTLLDAEEKELIFESKGEAEEILGELGTEGWISGIKVKRKETRAPLLFSLPELQGVIGRKYKYSPAKTLQIAQALYEKRLISYPRTDSCYLTSDLRRTIDRNLECCRFGKFKAALERCEKLKAVDDTYFNDEMVLDHHALIPTDNRNIRNIYGKLSGEERQVFDEIVFSFLGLFSKERVTISVSTTAFVEGGYLFRVTESMEEEPGFRMLRDVPESEISLSPFVDQLRSAIQDGEIPAIPVKVSGFQIKEKVSSPPTRYNYGSIIALMKNFKIGTPATMAGTIEKLLDKKHPFLTVKNGKYYSTPFGRMYISVIPEELKDPELTMQMEWKLQQVRNGDLHKDQVLEEIMSNFIEDMKRTDFQRKSFQRCLQIKKPSRDNYKRRRMQNFE